MEQLNTTQIRGYYHNKIIETKVSDFKAQIPYLWNILNPSLIILVDKIKENIISNLEWHCNMADMF